MGAKFERFLLVIVIPISRMITIASARIGLFEDPFDRYGGGGKLSRIDGWTENVYICMI